MLFKLILFIAIGVDRVHHCLGYELVTRYSETQDKHSRLGIFHGHVTTIQKHPYLVAILNNGSFYCAGTIVNDHWIVTSADCANNFDGTTTIVAGSSDGLTGSSFIINSVVLHPNYGSSILDYDYACVQIVGKFKWSKKTKAIHLPKKEPKVNTTMTVAGWGDDEVAGRVGERAPNPHLLQGTMTWVDKQICNSTYSWAGLTWTDRMACAYNRGKTTLCSGDWADAFVHKGVFYGQFLAGGSGFCNSNAQPLILADIYQVVSWIKQITGTK
ncbi:trypsin-7-like [Homalodisca vitripennis]|uniref:trypsin-7-like n=1 Tax=Homalodisca vitripennis TaxID=197043 RepID=UPI001EEB2E6B|nr:trypsin-7-like [Homalodisca vitripennis]